MLDVIKTAVENIDWRFVILSRLRYNEYVHMGNPHWLERPFAYEIYHQLRCIWNERYCEFDCLIQAEVFKDYQQIRYVSKMPDLLFHAPNSTERNLAVVEIKLASNSKKELTDDLAKLALFHKLLKYQTLVEILIGSDAELHTMNERLDKITSKEAHRSMFCRCLWMIRPSMFVGSSFPEASVRRAPFSSVTLNYEDQLLVMRLSNRSQMV